MNQSRRLSARAGRPFILLLLMLWLPLVSAAQEQTWRINLKNADIREFITQIATITGKSFIVDPRVKGKVTVISNATLDSAATYELFLSVLRVHGYAAVGTGGVIKIVQQVLAKQSGSEGDFREDVTGEEMITRVIPVINTSAVELTKILRPMIPQYGQIAGLVTPNALIVSDHADNILRLIDIIQRIDVADNSSLMILQLQEAWVEDMVALLEKLAPEQIGKGAKGPNSVTVVANERTNSLVFKGEPSTLEKMRALVADLDQPATRLGTTQVIRLAHSDATEMADILKNLIAQTEEEKKAQGTQDQAIHIQADPSLNALVVRANPASMQEVRDIIEKLDIRRLQVLIEAAIVEVNTNFEKQLGSELIVGDTSASSLPVGITAPSGILATILQSLAIGGTGTPPKLGDAPLFAAGRTDDNGINFALIIRALSQNTDVNLLSTPSIMTMDNETAKIIVGQSVPFRTGATVTGSEGAANPFTTIKREDVGLTLEVTPHIHDGNLVRLEVNQEVSEVEDRQNIGNAGTADLLTSKRTIQTTILADNGEVIVLGGLIRDKTSSSTSKVPILGSIPLVGRLFKSKGTMHDKQNLLVFLRPTVLTSKEQSSEISERKLLGVWQTEIKGTDPHEKMSDLFKGKK